MNIYHRVYDLYMLGMCYLKLLRLDFWENQKLIKFVLVLNIPYIIKLNTYYIQDPPCINIVLVNNHQNYTRKIPTIQNHSSFTFIIHWISQTFFIDNNKNILFNFYWDLFF